MTCTLNSQGFGSSTNCTLTTASPTSTVVKQFLEDPNRDLVPAFSVNGSIYGIGEYDSANVNATTMAHLRAVEEIGRLDIASVFKSNTSCTADVSIHTCSLHRALIEYDVLIQNATIKLQQPNWQQDKVLSNL
jgi:hypothetical protein